MSPKLETQMSDLDSENFLKLYFLCFIVSRYVQVGGCLYMGMRTGVQVPAEARGIKSPKAVAGACKPMVWVLGTKFKTPGRAASILTAEPFLRPLLESFY